MHGVTHTNAAAHAASISALFCAFSCICSPAYADDTGHAETSTLARAVTDVTIDGRLDDPSWANAPVMTRFFEISPGNVAAPPVQTEARFLYDEHNLYIGIRAHDDAAGAIRASVLRRDQVMSDEDYVEVLLDPLNSRHSALLFRTNAAGVATDGIFDEAQQTRDFTPDFDFEVRATRDAGGWTAELRIPLATLRYQPAGVLKWGVIVLRNRPRENSVVMASAPIPRGTNCILCFAGEIEGAQLERSADTLFLTPQMTYSRLDTGADEDDRLRAGLDVKWQPRPGTVLDATLAPDFSQVEADDLQFTANMRFPLSVTEKRPFFLEGSDLLTTPITAIYTRSLVDPDYGARLTHRDADREYTMLYVRDAGGGSMLEPGPVASTLAPQDFHSDVLVGRHAQHLGGVTLGTLATARRNDDGSENVVYGADSVWSLSTSDRITGQLLHSQTRNPDRPDLLPAWTGQSLSGGATALGWEHSQDAWSANVTYKSYSHGFRAWDGFVSQVGVSALSATSAMYFYPAGNTLTRVAPTLSVTSLREVGGTRIKQYITPGILIEGAHDTSLTLNWYAREQDLTSAGLRTYRSYYARLATTPFSWMPQATFTAWLGDNVNFATGEIGTGTTLTAQIPLRLFARLELITSLGYQSLESRLPNAHRRNLFTQKNAQLNAIWHFNGKWYAQALIQRSTFAAAPEFFAAPDAGLALESRSRLTSFLLSYQSNWQTRYFVGFRRSGPDSAVNEVFAKLSYVLAR